VRETNHINPPNLCIIGMLSHTTFPAINNVLRDRFSSLDMAWCTGGVGGMKNATARSKSGDRNFP
jgi:hypothetical protein